MHIARDEILNAYGKRWPTAELLLDCFADQRASYNMILYHVGGFQRGLQLMPLILSFLFECMRKGEWEAVHSTEPRIPLVSGT